MTRQIVSTHDARKGFIAARREPRLTLSFVVRSFAGSIPRAPDQGFRRSPGRRFRRSLQRVRRRGTFKLSPTRRLVSSRLSCRRLLFEKRITVKVFTHTVDPTTTHTVGFARFKESRFKDGGNSRRSIDRRLY